jgi:hypothetical protein
MLSTGYFPFSYELTGVEITREATTPLANDPDNEVATRSTIYHDFTKSRIVRITPNQTTVDEYDKQREEKFLLYLDREFVGIVQEGDRVRFRIDELGMNTLFVDNRPSSVTVGYIRRLVYPQAQSSIGSLECYITTNN